MLLRNIIPKMNSDEVRQLVEDAIKDAEVTVYSEEHDDERSEGAHFQIKVVSPEFRDKSRVERHRLVQKALRSHIGNEIHAVEIRARTPDET